MAWMMADQIGGYNFMGLLHSACLFLVALFTEVSMRQTSFYPRHVTDESLADTEEDDEDGESPEDPTTAMESEPM